MNYIFIILSRAIPLVRQNAP